MSGWTNRGKYRALGWSFCGDTIPTNFYVALVTKAVVPTAKTKTFSELTEIAAGNGYDSGGYQIAPNHTDFDVHIEDDDFDRAFIQIKDIIWNASGGPIPASGDGAHYAVLTDNNATIVDRDVFFTWDLEADKQTPDGQPFTLEDSTFRIEES